VGIRKSWTKASSGNQIATNNNGLPNGTKNGTPAPQPKSLPSSPGSQTVLRISKGYIPTPTGDFAKMLEMDLPHMLGGLKLEEKHSSENLLIAEHEEAKDDLFIFQWNKLYGSETFVVEWPDFVRGLAISISKPEEDSLKTIIDYSRTGSVTRYKFQEFLKGFGPLERCVANVKSVVSAEWFHGFISANESKKFLELQPIGTFLIRFSGSRPGSFVLDYVREPGHVRSVRLSGHPTGGFSALIEGGQTKERVFKTLAELVETYASMNVLSRPFSTSLTNQPWFYGDLSGEEAEQLLMGQPPGVFLIRFSTQPGCFAASFVTENSVVKKGLISKVSSPNAGFQVNNTGMVFQSLDNLVDHYKLQNIFVTPYQQ